MNRQAFRSACSVARSEGVLSTPTPVSFFRSFSSTPSVLAEENSNNGSQPPSNPRPSAARQRGRAAASQINKFAASRPPAGANGSNPASSAGRAGNQPKVLDIRSVPAGLGRGRGRGGLFRGRGGANNTARSTSPAGGASGNRFSGAGRGGARGGARGSFRGGAGSSRGSARGGTRGGRGGARGGRKGDGADKKDNNAGGGGRRKDPFEVMDPAEQEFDNAMRFGTTTTYKPSITLEDLAQFAPAVPTSSAGRRATVLQNLSLLGGSEQVATPRNYQVSDAAEQLSKAGARFFADATQKTAAETYLQSKPVAEGQEAPAVQPVEDAIRQTITEQAVKGTHEAPKFASNWQEMMHSTFLRSESYKAKDMAAFETKVAALAGKVEAAKPAAKKPAAEKKAPKAKAKAA